MAIKGPTSAEFRPHSGCNLLIVGQHEQAALGMMISSIVSVAAESRPSKAGARFYVLNGGPTDASGVDFFKGLFDQLPHTVNIAGRRQVAPLMADLAEELERSIAAADPEFPPCFLFVYNLGRSGICARGKMNLASPVTREAMRSRQLVPPNSLPLFSVKDPTSEFILVSGVILPTI